MRETMKVSRLIAYTRIEPERAIVRVNGVRKDHLQSVVIHRGDQITVRRLKKRRKIRRTKRPSRPHRIKKTQREQILILPSGKKVGPEAWIDALPDQWLKHDGSVAVEPSFVRCDPRAEQWYSTLKQIAARFGYESDEFRAYARHIAELSKSPIGEVYTLFWSH